LKGHCDAAAGDRTDAVGLHECIWPFAKFSTLFIG